MSLQDTIKKFQTLPPNIQQALSSDEAMAKMEALEGKYNLKLASFVLRAAVKEFPFEDLGIVIRKELNLKPEQAGLLKDEILDQIFAPVVNYYAESEEKAVESAESPHLSPLPQGERKSVLPPRPPIVPSRPQPISSPADIQDDKREKKDDNGGKADEKGEKGLDISNQAPSKLQVSGFRLQASPPPPQPPKSRSYFYFDAEDEKDVEKFKKHEAVIAGGAKDFLEQIDKAADETIDRSMIAISDENARNRLKSYLTAYFRGIRDILQTKESLAKPLANGGMEFDAVSIERIMALAKEEFKKIHSGSPVEREITPPLNLPLSKGEAEGVESRAQPSNQNQSNSQDSGFRIQDSSQITIRRERPQVIDTDKPKIAEVRLPSKLTGPLEEVEQLSLKDLRRFAQNHQGFADRTMERIKILETESFEKRMMGIAAWRKSLLYRQYLNVIQNSLERNVSIPEMIGSINEMESQNMSLREWQTVNRLNRELKS